MKRKQRRREKHTQIKALNPLLSEAAFDVGDFLFSELLEGSGKSPSSPACASLLLKKGAPSNFSTHRPQVWVGTQHKVPPPCNSQSGGRGGGADQPASTSSLNGKTLGAGTPGASFQRQPAGKHQRGQASHPHALGTIKPSQLAPFTQLNSCLQSSPKSLGGGMSIINWVKRTDYAK